MSEMNDLKYMEACLFVLCRKSTKREMKQKYHLMLHAITINNKKDLYCLMLKIEKLFQDTYNISSYLVY